MAGLSMISQFPTNSVSSIPPSHKLNSKISLPTANSVRFPAKSSRKSNVRFAGRKFSLTLRAAVNEDFKVENDGYVAEEPQTEVELLKKQLVDRFYGTNFGLSATSETRAEILELITQLEVMNPTPEPTEALPLLDGKWILAYTSCAGLYSLLSSGTLPLVKLEEISQTIDSENFTVQNGFVFSGLGSTTAITVNATFEVRSPKRVQIKFDEGIIGTPQLTDLIEIPESIEVLGQKVDLASFKGLIESVEDTVAKTISSQPPWKFSISETNVESWLLTTYLDGELRISREDCGKVFVLFKEGSPLLSP